MGICIEYNKKKPVDSISVHIKHAYTDVVDEKNRHTYGGSQLFFDGMIKRCGCSLIAAADVILYITGCHKPISIKAYRNYIRQLAPAFPLVPYRGIPGVVLAFFLNVYLWRRGLPYRAHFGRTNLIDDALKSDLPVILCIGPGIHQFLKPKEDRGIMLYSAVKGTADTIDAADNNKCGNTDLDNNKCGCTDFNKSDAATQDKTDALIPFKRVRSHFVVITAVNKDFLTVSSWGSKYYISRTELSRYAALDLCGLFTNVIVQTSLQ